MTEKRPKRTPLHKQKNLAFKERPGFVRRVVNETYGRVEAFIEAGWSLVSGDENISDTKAQNASQLTSVTRTVVNKQPGASCQTAVLMEIPEELYYEDQRDKQAHVDKLEASYDPAKFKKSDQYGELKITHNEEK